MSATALYRHWRGEDLLYVGISSNLLSRNAAHERTSQWLHEVDRITVEWFANRPLAMDAERRAIQGESPRFNQTFTSKRRAPSKASMPPYKRGLEREDDAIWLTLNDGAWHRIGDILAHLADSGESMRCRVRRELKRMVEVGAVHDDGHPRARQYRKAPRATVSRQPLQPVPEGLEMLTIRQIQALSGASPESISLAIRTGRLKGIQRTTRGRWYVQRDDAVAWALGRQDSTVPRLSHPSEMKFARAQPAPEYPVGQDEELDPPD